MKIETFEQIKPSIVASAASTEDAVAQLKSLIEKDPITDDQGQPVDIEIKIDEPKKEEKSVQPKVDHEQIAKSVIKQITPYFESQKNKAVEAQRSIPAEARRWSSKLKAFSNEENAYAFGQLVLASAGNKKSLNWLEANYKAAPLREDTGTHALLVPDEVLPDLVHLTEQYGVARRHFNVKPMSRETLTFNAVISSVTVGYVNENTAPSETEWTVDDVTLVAKKLFARTSVSNELMEDAIVSVGEQTATQFAIAMARQEDLSAFIGGASYGSFQGITAALKAAGGGTLTAAKGVHTVSSDWDSITMNDLTTLFALLPAYSSQGAGNKIYCSSAFRWRVLDRLSYGAGGVTRSEFTGRNAPSFAGMEIVESQVLKLDDDADTTEVDAIVGNLGLACYMGDRRSITISTNAFSDEAFSKDLTQIRAIERVSFHVPDGPGGVGDTTTAGPVVALVCSES